jgi:hypothetical protein
MTSVPLREAGVASGVNSAVREIGGVFGVALAAVVFSTYGGYTTPQEFSDGLVPALWTAAGLSALGAVAAVFVPGRSARPVEDLVRVPETVAD